MTKSFFDLVRVHTATTGTGTITLGSAVSGFLSFDVGANGGANIPNGAVVSYGIEDGAHRETGVGVLTISGTTFTLTRSVKFSTTYVSNAFAPISLSGSAELFVTAISDDMSLFETAAPNFTPQVPFKYLKVYLGGVWAITLSTLVAYDTTSTLQTPSGYTVAGTTQSLPWSDTLENGYASIVMAFTTPVIPSAIGYTLNASTGFPGPAIISGSNDSQNWTLVGTLPVAGDTTAHVTSIIYPTTNYITHVNDAFDVKGVPTAGQTLAWNGTDNAWEPYTPLDIIADGILTLSDPSAARFWRLGSLTNTNATVALAEVAFHITTGGSPVTATWSASSSYASNYGPSYLGDGNTSTAWASSGAGTTGLEWVQADLGTSVRPVEVEIWARADYISQAPVSFQLLSSQNGVDWTVILSETSLTWASNPTTFTLPSSSPPQLSPYVALDNLSNVGSTAPTDGQMLIWSASASKWVPGPTMPTDTTSGDTYTLQYIVGTGLEWVFTSSGGGGDSFTAATGTYDSATVSGFVSAARTGGAAIGALATTTFGSNEIEGVYTASGSLTLLIANGTSSAITGITSITVPGVTGTFTLSSATATFMVAGYWQLVWTASGTATSGTLTVT